MHVLQYLDMNTLNSLSQSYKTLVGNADIFNLKKKNVISLYRQVSAGVSRESGGNSEQDDKGTGHFITRCSQTRKWATTGKNHGHVCTPA